MLHLDLPEDGVIRQSRFRLQGWYAAKEAKIPDELLLGGRSFSFSPVVRSDVEAAHTGMRATGFGLTLHLSEIIDRIPDEGLRMELRTNGRELEGLTLSVTEEARKSAESGVAAWKEKQAWVRSHIRCSVCRTDKSLVIGEDVIRCPECETDFDQHFRAANLLAPDLDLPPRVHDSTAVSMHDYDDIARSLIEEIRAQGGMVLDCGAGLREVCDPCVVTTEIFDFPTTDVLAVNEALPFPDNTFDAALSLNVLEHVTDPSRCAQELERVVKPGGRMYCVAAFLQPEHDYPGHFFNMTRTGLRKLFSRSTVVDSQFVPTSGHPIWTLQWFLRLYLEGLPEDERKRFSKMSIEEVVERPIEEWLGDDIVMSLSQGRQFPIASTTALIMKAGTPGSS
ncbi:MAG: methyltransferase domain-containing protein [Planctomycetota bacterium]|nr:methyltransferase domain-containing protein [Planctomycetota bacterium]